LRAHSRGAGTVTEQCGACFDLSVAGNSFDCGLADSAEEVTFIEASDHWFAGHPELQPWADGMKYNVYRGGWFFGAAPYLEKWWCGDDR
jgi:hypothetical protein